MFLGNKKTSSHIRKRNRSHTKRKNERQRKILGSDIMIQPTAHHHQVTQQRNFRNSRIGKLKEKQKSQIRGAPT